MSQGFTKSTAIIDAAALIGDTLAPNVVFSSLTQVGALASGSIVPGFGPIDMDFIASEDGQAVLRLAVDAAGFGDINAIDTFYDSGALAAGEKDGVFVVSIDGSAAAGGAIIGLAVLATVGLAAVVGVGVGTGVAPVAQRSGTFGDMDSALVNAVDRLTEFTTSGVDIQMFVANGDTVTIGNTAKFQEIEFLLAIVASNPGIKPTFEFSDGVGGFIPFVPVDGTDGMRNNGVIAWDDVDLVGWAQESGEFLIRITRTASAAITPPTEDLVQISSTTLFFWDKDGNVSINDLALAGILGVTGLASFQDVEVALTLAVTGASAFSGSTDVLNGNILRVFRSGGSSNMQMSHNTGDDFVLTSSFSGKVWTFDRNGGFSVPENLAITGETGLGIAVSASAFGTFGAATTAKASARLPHGSAPASPVDGDEWTTTSGKFIRINGVTEQVAFV